MQIVSRREIAPFVTKDGSEIREYAHPSFTAARAQSLAEATVAAGARTEAHHHARSEEIYLFTAGSGRLRLGAEWRPVAAGDCVVIPPGTVHELENDGAAPLVLLCACAPAYSHDDTYLEAAGATG